MRFKHSFSSRLSLYIIAASMGIFLLTILAVGTVSNTIMIRDARDNAAKSLELCTVKIENSLAKVESAAHSLIWLVKEHNDDPEYMYDITRKLLEFNPEIVGSTVAFEPNYFPEKGVWYAPYSYRDEATGMIITIQMGGESYQYHDMEWYAVPRSTGENYWSDPYMDEGGGEQVMTTYSIPLWDENGNIYAVFTADINLNSLTEEVSKIKPYKNSYIILVGRQGQFISHPDKSKILTDNIFSASSMLSDKRLAKTQAAMLARENGYDSFFSPYGYQAEIVYGPLNNGWTGAIIFRSTDAFESTTSVRWAFLIALVIGMILLFYACKKLILRTTMPVTEYAYSAMNMAQGNFHARIPEVKSEDELKRLHDSLMYMQKSVNSYIEQLRSTTASNERFESELNIASKIQQEMLTHNFPSTDNLDVYALLQPAKEVGGDLYDVFVRDNVLYFVVGDVSGKGVPAALYMAISRAAFRFIASMGLKVDEVISKINNAFADGNSSGMFVTLFFGRIDLKTLKMEYCNGGHNPIIIKHADGSADYLRAKANIAAGLFEDFPYVGEELQLAAGDRLLLYTDGVSEAETAAKELYGDDRLLDYARSANGTSREFADGLLSSVREYTGGNPQNDDITIMSILLK